MGHTSFTHWKLLNKTHPFFHYRCGTKLQNVLDCGRLSTQSSFHKQTSFISKAPFHRGSMDSNVWNDWHNFQSTISFLLSYWVMQHVLVISLQWCMPLYQLEAISRLMETTVQQNPWCYRRISEIQGTRGHPEHVFLSSGGLYALRPSLLWTQRLGHKPPPWSEGWNRFQPC